MDIVRHHACEAFGRPIRALRDPMRCWLWLLGRCRPAWLYRRYARLARRQGFDQLYVILSYDCDTPGDAPAALRVWKVLCALGFKATFAVPGVLLESARGVYADLAAQGAEFINHGALPHTSQDGGTTRSVTFYHEMPWGSVADDVRRGHDLVARIAGAPPIGFRAPHFGYLRAAGLLDRVHRMLVGLGYAFSSCTLPHVAFEHGPAWCVNGLLEFPVSGAYDTPVRVLDSWGHLVSAQHPVVTEEYGRKIESTIARLMNLGVNGLLNYYADPSQVQYSRSYSAALERIGDLGVRSISFADAVALVRRMP